MKCPRCGKEMIIDTHRKISLPMCYECGYIEGRNVDKAWGEASNFAHLKTLNLNEAAAFIASGLNLDTGAVAAWLYDIQ